MRKLMNLLAMGVASLLFASNAGALAYTGNLEIVIGTLSPIVVNGSGDGVSTPGSVVIGPDAFLTTITVPVVNATNNTFPAFPIVDLRLNGPAGLSSASFAAGAGPNGGFGGDAGLAGQNQIGLFGPPPFFFITVPLGAIGVEGATEKITTTLPRISLFGGGWTTGAATVLTAQASGTDQRTAGGAGTLVLVSPTLVRTSISGSETLAVMSTLTLNFVPEPGTLLLLGSGIAGLAAYSRRRASA